MESLLEPCFDALSPIINAIDSASPLTDYLGYSAMSAGSYFVIKYFNKTNDFSSKLEHWTWSRNPTYLGVRLLLLGITLKYPSEWAILCGSIYYASGCFTVKGEEKRLLDKFGTEYEEYMKEVPRWFNHRKLVSEIKNFYDKIR